MRCYWDLAAWLPSSAAAVKEVICCAAEIDRNTAIAPAPRYTNMKAHNISIILTAALSASHVAHSQTLTNIDYTPVDGTSWNAAPSSAGPYTTTSTSVRLDFGEGIGLGTISFDPINSGWWQLRNPNNSYAYSPTTLSTGALFAPTEEVILSLRSNPGADATAGVMITVTLDSGSFPEGSMFSIRSLARGDTGFQQITLLSGLSSADPVQLPSDSGPPSPELVETSPGSGIYAPAVNTGASAGRAFGITGSSFSVAYTGNYNGGAEAFNIVVPVPEPSGAILLGLSGLTTLVRRRR